MTEECNDSVVEYLWQIKNNRNEIKDIGEGGPGNPHVILFENEVYLSPDSVKKLYNLNYIITEVRGKAVTVSPLPFPDSGAIPDRHYDDHGTHKD